MNTNRYLRLMCLAGIEVLLTVPLGCLLMRAVIDTVGVEPWISWEDTHSGFSRHNKVPAVAWQAYTSVLGDGVMIELNRYPIILCSIVFFAFFGFAEEARHNYRTAFWSVARRFGYTLTVYSPSARWVSNLQDPNNDTNYDV
jgi:pheromone a factor receptor